MIPEKLVISAWGPYKNKEEIDFTPFMQRGVFLITGATGAGKTTLFDAITYALYGNLSGSVREKTSVRSDFAESACPTFVELSMRHGGEQYRIFRNPEYTRPSKRGTGSLTVEKENAILYLPDNRVLEGTRIVNEKLQEILSLDYRQFKQITMLAQGEFAKLLTADAKEKKEILRSIFDTDIYARFAALLRQRADTLQTKVKEERQILREVLSVLLEESAAKGEAESLQEMFHEDQINYTAVEENLKVLLSQTGKEEKALQKECGRLQEEKERLEGEKTGAERENRDIGAFMDAERTLKKLEAQKDEIEEDRIKLKRAGLAANLKTLQQDRKQKEKTLKEKETGEAKSLKEHAAHVAERETLQEFAKHREAWERYLEIDKQLTIVKEREAEAEKNYESALLQQEKAKTDYISASEAFFQKKDSFEQADLLYRNAVAGVAARMLVPGKPCPVCGSLEHPAPAKEEPGLPSEEELKKLKGLADEADGRRGQAQEAAAQAKAKLNEREEQLQAAKEECRQLTKKEQEYRKLLQTDEEAFFHAPHEEKEAYVAGKIKRMTELDTLLSSGEKQLAGLKEELVLCKKEASESSALFEKTLKKEGFSSEEEWETACLSENEQEDLSRRIRAYEQEWASADGVKKHLKDIAEGKELKDLTVLTEAAQNCGQLLKKTQEERTKVNVFLEKLKKAQEQFLKKRRSIEAAEEEYGYVASLARLARGENARRLEFEQYVLAGYFDEILRAANLRFYQMTGGRYEMRRVARAEDGRSRDSLEIWIKDYYTGRERSVKTLSGGESFKASLSLALGMSDVIQAANGGIRVETLFLDEGFGALDAESLDQACETLMGLSKGSRLIGIISHVPELRERINDQIFINKTNTGSTVKAAAGKHIRF